MKYIILFEKFAEEPEVKLLIERKLKKLKYLPGEYLTIDDVRKRFDFPEEILKMMSTWNVIYKSPYSDSLYSSNDVKWGYKPDKSYRVSDHWNFYKRGNWHCETDKRVRNNTHISIGQYDKESGKYNIILSLPTKKQSESISKKKVLLKYLKDPETIFKKKQFKNKINNKEVMIKLTYDGKNYEGIVRKYTGSELKIEDENRNQIFAENYMDKSKTQRLEFFDRNGDPIEDPIQYTGR